MEPRLRILWSSNSPWCGSGYGAQTALFTQRLRDLGHEVYVAANYGLSGAGSVWNGIPVLPAAFDGTGCDVLPAHVQSVKPDMVIILADAWPLNPATLKALPCPVAVWMPVDSDVLGAADERMLRASEVTPIAMSRHGEKALKTAGFSPIYIPHGVDAQVFKPPADRGALREKWGVAGKFVIGINGANKDGLRKAYAEQFLAFGRFRKAHPEALLLVHSFARQPGSVDLTVLARRTGIDGAVLFTDEYKYAVGLISPAELAEWYGVLDVYSGPSYAEGFGVPLIEAPACGTPVVTTGASAMTELKGPGWAVTGEPFYNAVHEAWWLKPGVKAIERAYEKAFKLAASRRPAAREFALQYDADVVLLDYFKPALDAIMERAKAA
jgi:glycosyltransferase involved in cell wall biosynthesis